MPLMIPSKIPPGAPVSEKIIFETLKYAAQGRWDVFHSVSINSCHLDFVILNPQHHSVICLEVVEDESYEFKAGTWASPSGKTLTSPLDQAKRAMTDLKNHFATLCSHSRISWGYAVAFTDGTRFHAVPKHLVPIFDSLESLPEHLSLITEYCSSPSDATSTRSLGDTLEDYARALSSALWKPLNSLAKHQADRDAVVVMEELRFELEQTMITRRRPQTIFRSDLETLRPQLLRLTTEQLHSLKVIQIPRNRRWVIDGAAGTGKTVLAMELARQRCEEKGESVALLCSNPYLSRRFERWAETLSSDKGGRVVAGTPATLPLEAFGDSCAFKDNHQRRLDASPQLEESLKSGNIAAEWEPFINETVTDLGQGDVFDYLIVDEAQHLCDEVFLKLMDALLKGSLADGRWAMFGDFINQNIVFPQLQDGKDMLANRGLNFFEDMLEINCRNTLEIAAAAFMFVNIKSRPMFGVHGPQIQIEHFNSQEDLRSLLDRLVTDLRDRDFQPQQITLLTADVDDEFTNANTYGGWRLHNICEETLPPLKSQEGVLVYDDSAADNVLKYSSIYDFQGLESDLVILVTPSPGGGAGGDILPNYEHLRRVLYTGMSRAKVMLIIVAHKDYEEHLELEPPFQLSYQEHIESFSSS